MDFIDNDLYHTRGDTGGFYIRFYDEDNNPLVVLEKGDTITFTVKSSPLSSQILIQKVVNIEDYASEVEICVKPEDTSNLKFGKYYYDVELKTVNDDVLTISKKDSLKVGRFVLTNEVTI